MRLYDNVDTDLTNSLSRGLLILECFTARRPRLSPSQIQTFTKIPRATLFRLLKILIRLNYLQYDEESKKYYLGSSVLRLGFSVLQTLKSREIIRPYLEELSREFNRSIGLLMMDNNEMVYIERIRVPSLRDFNISVGSRIHIFMTAAGKAFLAYLSQDKLEQIIDETKKDKQTAQYIGKNGKKLFSYLAEARRQGYSISDEETYKGVRAIAAPIFSSEGVTYAINLVVPPEEVSIDELRRTYAPRLMDTCRKISRLLGHQDE